MLGELAANHRATINEPLSLPVKLINCLLPTVLCLTWGNKTDAAAMQSLENRRVNQKHKGRGWRSGNAIRSYVLAEIIRDLGVPKGKF